MRFFDIGQEAHGVIAVGQFATGVIAIGQIALGVVAIGQVARGVFVIGQAALGLWSLGMVGGGVVATAAMVGVGGRGLGLVIPLTPSLGPRHSLPKLHPASALSAGVQDQGWARVTLRAVEGGVNLYDPDGQPLGALIDAPLRPTVRTLTAEGEVQRVAQLRRVGDRLVCVGLMEEPASRLRSPRWWLIWSLQLAGLTGLAAVFWGLVVIPLSRALVG